MNNVFALITLLFLAIFSLSSCASSGYAQKDYTVNRSRAKKSVARTRPARMVSTPARPAKSMSTTRADLLDKARKYVGTPYRYGGKDPSGFDCSGFTQYVFRSQGMQLPANSSAQARSGKKLAPLQAQPGDLLIFEERGRVQHVGLVVDNGRRSLKMIHASSSQGVVIEDVLDSSYWKKRMAYAVRVLGS